MFQHLLALYNSIKLQDLTVLVHYYYPHFSSSRQLFLVKEI